MSRYVLEHLLAEGGMAEVFLARATSGPWAGHRVVVKRVREHLADSEELRDMFAREAALAMQLEHPNIVRVLDVGETEDGLPFLTMEWLDGLDLHAILGAVRARGETIHPAYACAVASQIARGLHHAHVFRDPEGHLLGVVHRDVSPHNVFLTLDGAVKLLDFGIAKTNRAAATRTGIVRGKAAYMAPEQIAGLDVDPRADLFALGVVLWEMLTGRRLWPFESETGIARAVRDESAPPPSVHVPAAAGELDAVVLALLAKFPAARPRSAEIVADALGRLAQRYGSRSPQAETRELVARAESLSIPARLRRDG
ncbi:MAG: serine/threonine-protein kinase [Labilithrix sp.]